jgi:hypothetical protein
VEDEVDAGKRGVAGGRGVAAVGGDRYPQVVRGVAHRGHLVAGPHLQLTRVRGIEPVAWILIQSAPCLICWRVVTISSRVFTTAA